MHYNGRYWLRLAANIYNCEEDFMALKEILLQASMLYYFLRL